MCNYVDGGILANCTPTAGWLFFNPGVRGALVKVDCRENGYCPDLDQVDVMCSSMHTATPTTEAILGVLLAVALVIIVVLSSVSATPTSPPTLNFKKSVKLYQIQKGGSVCCCC